MSRSKLSIRASHCSGSMISLILEAEDLPCIPVVYDVVWFFVHTACSSPYIVKETYEITLLGRNMNVFVASSSLFLAACLAFSVVGELHSFKTKMMGEVMK